MDSNQARSCLKASWQRLLENRGHYIYRKTIHPNVIRSRNGSKKRYRWLLQIENSPTRRLSKSEQDYIRYHIKQAKSRREIAYLVIGFTQEPRRIVAILAKTALKAGQIRCDKGGIAWDE